MADEFTCDVCGGTFEKGWPDEEAEKEYAGSFNELTAGEKEDRAELCEDCYRVFMGDLKRRRIE